MTLESVKKEIALRKNSKSKNLKIKNNRISNFFIKLLITIIITLGLLIGIKSSEKFSKVFYENVLEKNFPFSKINDFYKKHFGTSIPFSKVINNDVNTVFSEKLNFINKEKYKDGVKLTVSKNYLVPSLKSGMVVFIGEKDIYGKTIIIQQIDGTDVWYSNIDKVSVNLYDYIEEGKLLGEVKDDNLILVFKKDGKIVDYEKMLN